MPRSAGSRLRSTLACAADLPENIKNASPSLDEGPAALVDSPRMGEQQPAGATAQLQAQLPKTLQDALCEVRTMHRISEEARQRERDQLHGRIHELTDKEGRRTAEIGDLNVKVAELESKLLGGQQADAGSRRVPLSTEIQLDPLSHTQQTPARTRRTCLYIRRQRGTFRAATMRRR